MKQPRDLPFSWVVPSWHPDVCDLEIEFSLLQRFAGKLLQELGDLYSVDLDDDEEGYLEVVVIDRSRNNKIANVLVMPIREGEDNPRFGLYIDSGNEYYPKTIEDVMDILRNYGERIE